MSDVRAQLRSYYAEIDERQAPVTETEARLWSHASATGRWSGSARWVVSVAALAACVAVVVAVVIAGLGPKPREVAADGDGPTLEFQSHGQPGLMESPGQFELFNTSNPVWSDGHLYVTTSYGVRRTTDGITWEEWLGQHPAPPSGHLGVWEGKVLVEGVGIVDSDTDQTLIPHAAVVGMDVMFSEFGMVGISNYDPEQVGGTLDAVYSLDGTQWRRWSLDIDTETSLELVGIGDGFAVLGEWYSRTIWVAELP